MTLLESTYFNCLKHFSTQIQIKSSHAALPRSTWDSTCCGGVVYIKLIDSARDQSTAAFTIPSSFTMETFSLRPIGKRKGRCLNSGRVPIGQLAGAGGGARGGGAVVSNRPSTVCLRGMPELFNRMSYSPVGLLFHSTPRTTTEAGSIHRHGGTGWFVLVFPPVGCSRINE